MKQRTYPTGLIFIAFMTYWIAPQLFFGSGEHFLAHAKSTASMSLSDAYHKHYQKQLASDEAASVQVKFWRKHRSYPHMDKAIRLIKKNRNREALAIYDQYLAADPNHHLMRWYRLILLSQITGPNEVIEAATEFLDRMPDFGPALMIRGFAQLKVDALTEAEEDFDAANRNASLLAQDRKQVLAQLYSLAYQRKDYSRSLKIARKLVETYPGNAVFHENYAQILFHLGDLPKSQKHWQKVLALSSDHHTLRRATLSQLMILIHNGQFTSANRVFEEAQRQDLFNALDALPDDHLKYLQFKATLSAKQGRIQMARGLIDDAIYYLSDRPNLMSDRDMAKAFQDIGDTAFEADVLDQALKAYTLSLSRKDASNVRLKASETAWQLKNYNRTIEMLRPLVFGDEAPEQSIRADVAERLCRAYGRQGQHQKAYDCFDKLLPRYPQNRALLSSAATAAGQNGLIQRQATLLKQSYNLRPSADKAMSIGYLYAEMKQHKNANHWFQKAYLNAPTTESGLAYANGLLAGRKIDSALDVLENLFALKTLSPEQMENAYGAMGSVYMQQKQYDKAIDIWHKALGVSSNPVWNIHRVTALRRSSQLKRAEVLFSTIPVVLLPPEDQLAWYDEAGELYLRTGRFEESLAALQEAASIDSSYERQLSLSMLLLKLNRLSEAEQHVDRALEHNPDSLVAQRHKAYVLAARGDNNSAVVLMERINNASPGDYETLHAMGFLYLKRGRKDVAVEFFKEAIDAIKIEQHGNAVIPVNRLHDLKATQSQIAELSRKFRYSLSQSVNVGQNDDHTHGVHLSNNHFSDAYGAAEVAYRPAFTGGLSGSIHELYAGALWTQDDGTSPEDETTTQGRIGMRIKPFTVSNLLIATESVFPFDGEQDPNVLLRVSHSFSRKLWQEDHESHRLFGPNVYLHTYAAVGRTFINDAEIFGNAQARIGRSTDINGRLFVSPFIYLLANGYDNETGSEAHGQAGMGMAVDYFSVYNRYKGYRGRTEILLRLGLDFDRDGENRDVNGLVGVQFKLF